MEEFSMTLPLTSIRVLDLTRLLPGPYCTLLLADFGADVIKIEDPALGDYARWGEPKIGNENPLFLSLNRNKKSVTLNLKTEEAKQIFIDMVKDADVLVESFRPGVMDRLGLGYHTLKEINPKLVYCAITGYGQDGPYAGYPGHDINYLSYAGMLEFNGRRDEKPGVPAVQIADIGGGALTAAVGVLLALQARNQTGEGQFVDISMMDGVISWLQTILPSYLATKDLPKRGELTLSGGKACYGVYETADGRFLSVGALEPKFWKVFCEKIEQPEFISRLEAPIDEQDQMKTKIESIIKGKNLAQWMEIFEGVDACVAPLHNLEEMTQDPQVRHRNMIVDVDHPVLGLIQQVGIPIKLSNTAGSLRTVAPQLGEHNEEIFTRMGHSAEQIAQWKKDGVL
jgi:crotonobetainyl-CoA:carnitine CoA-transferase CaiB-like acyl-CoA transferase